MVFSVEKLKTRSSINPPTPTTTTTPTRRIKLGGNVGVRPAAALLVLASALSAAPAADGEKGSSWKIESDRLFTRCETLPSPHAAVVDLPPPPSGVTMYRIRAYSPQQYAHLVKNESNEIHFRFDEPTTPNGEILRYEVTVDDVTRLIITEFTRRSNNAYLVQLKPWTLYYVRLRACNAGGCGESKVEAIRSAPQVPEGLPRPLLLMRSDARSVLFGGLPRVLNNALTKVQLRLYKSFSGNIFGQNMHTLSFNNFEKGHIIPEPAPDYGQMKRGEKSIYYFQSRLLNSKPAWSNKSEIIYQRETCSDPDVGCTSVIIPRQTPSKISPTTILRTTKTTMDVEWGKPNAPRGTVVSYNLYIFSVVDGFVKKIVFPPDQTFTTVEGLRPFTMYDVRLETCVKLDSHLAKENTDIGLPETICCIGIADQNLTLNLGLAITKEDLPTGQDPPIAIAAGPNKVRLYWGPPKVTNGNLTHYELYRDNHLMYLINDAINLEKKKVFLEDDKNLQPNTEYTYFLAAKNLESYRKGSAGAVSLTVRVKTLPGLPLGVQRPSILVLGAHSIRVTWGANPNVSVVRGQVVGFRVQLRKTLEPDIKADEAVCPEMDKQVDFLDLTAYTEYEARIALTNEAGHFWSDWVGGKTLMAPPVGLKPLNIDPLDSGTEALITWGEPADKRGKISSYKIHFSDTEVLAYLGLARVHAMRGLEPATDYTIRLVACTCTACCSQGKNFTFTTREIAPRAQPAPILLEPSKANSVSLIFRLPIIPNGFVILVELWRSERSDGGERRRRSAATEAAAPSTCLSSTPSLIYKTTDIKNEFNWVDDTVGPAKVYSYQVKAFNSAASVSSPCLLVVTPDSTPQHLNPPQVSAKSPTSLSVSWNAPATPNGRILYYQVQRNNNVPLYFDASAARTFVDEELVPFTNYTYVVTVCNAAGCIASATTTLSTPMDAPKGVRSPRLVAVTMNSVSVGWGPPLISNGIVDAYRLLVDGKVEIGGMIFSHTVIDLLPFTSYDFRVRICTDSGTRCTTGPSLIVRTSEAAPRDLSAPFLNVISAEAIEVTWAFPKTPNGVIRKCEVFRDVDGIPVYSGLEKSYVDKGLDPGIRYSYWIRCHNSVYPPATSVISRTTTLSSSPLGQNPPALVALSSSAIRAHWTQPSTTNGEIVAYRLYKNDLEVVCEGLFFHCVVENLQFYTEYRFRVESCTTVGCVRSINAYRSTAEAEPEVLGPPELSPIRAGIKIRWRPPERPYSNPISLVYEAERRAIFDATVGPDIVGESKRIYRGIMTYYEDHDPSLQPYSRYEYRVSAQNSAGKVVSDWRQERTSQAPPETIDSPEVIDVRGSRAVVRITSPTKPNGVVISYGVYLNGTRRPVSAAGALQVLEGLTPYTLYSVVAEACTKGGCTKSVSTSLFTNPLLPSGLDPPTIMDVRSTSAVVSWDFPAERNGDVSRFELWSRLGCPPAPQPVPEACPTDNPRRLVFAGKELTRTLTKLNPYVSYEVVLRAFNDEGFVETAWVDFRTKPSAPETISAPKVGVGAESRFVDVDWSGVFRLNDRLQRYEVSVDGKRVFEGLDHRLVYDFGDDDDQDDDNYDNIVEIVVAVKTASATSFVKAAPVLYDRSRLATVATRPPPTSAPVKMFYEETWFVACAIAMAVFAAADAVCLLFYFRFRDSPRTKTKSKLTLGTKKNRTKAPIASSSTPLPAIAYPARPAPEPRVFPAEKEQVRRFVRDRRRREGDKDDAMTTTATTTSSSRRHEVLGRRGRPIIVVEREDPREFDARRLNRVAMETRKMETVTHI